MIDHAYCRLRVRSDRRHPSRSETANRKMDVPSGWSGLSGRRVRSFDVENLFGKRLAVCCESCLLS